MTTEMTAILTTKAVAEHKERDFSVAALVAMSLLTIIAIIAGVGLIHVEHGFDGAVFTAALFGVLILINIIGYAAIVGVLALYDDATKSKKGYIRMNTEEAHLE